MSLSYDVVVVGGGISGIATSAALAELGLDTLLIEKGSIGSEGASRYSGGIVRHFDPDERIQRLADYSFARMRDTHVGRRFAETIRQSGVFIVLPDGTDVQVNNRNRGSEHAPPARLLTRKQAMAMGAVLNPIGDHAVLYESESGYGDVRFTCRALAEAVRQKAPALEHAHVTIDDCSAAGVSLRLGQIRISSKRVVIATGSCVKHFFPQLPAVVRSIPMVRMKTRTRWVEPVIDFTIPSHVVPAGEGFIHIGSKHRSQAEAVSELHFDEAAIINNGIENLSAITGQENFGAPIDVIRGHDSYIENGPTFGRSGEAIYLAAGLGGIGYKLAIGIGWLLAKAIQADMSGAQLGGPEQELLHRFCPTRDARAIVDVARPAR